jgi:soluble lytic murein transglycosylase-like protein
MNVTNIKKYFCCILFFMAATVSSVHADIFIFVDSEGTLHFTNTPVSSNYRLYIKEYPKNQGSTTAYVTDRYDHLIAEAAQTYEVPFPLLKAIIKAESNFDPKAVSRVGASGLMQIMPENFESFNIKDPFNPWENIMAGTGYFSSLLMRFNGKLPLALAAYNAGPSMVDKYNDIPPFLETQDYVEKVIKYYYLFKKG